MSNNLRPIKIVSSRQSYCVCVRFGTSSYISINLSQYTLARDAGTTGRVNSEFLEATIKKKQRLTSVYLYGISIPKSIDVRGDDSLWLCANRKRKQKRIVSKAQ